jgi:RNA polymerase sigma-54 factor
MSFEQKLALKLSQRLVMTPSLQQAIKLLQMTRFELEAAVAHELEENPVLEVVEEPLSPETVAPTEQADLRETAAESILYRDHRKGGEEQMDFGALLQHLYSDEVGEREPWEDREDPPFENRAATEASLADHLLQQLRLLKVPPREQAIAEAVIGNLDEDGFLAATEDEIAAMVPEGEPPWSLEEIRSAIARVQRLDPPGVACRDLRESLLVQLEVAGFPKDALVTRLVCNHWDALLRRRYAELATELNVPVRAIEEAVKQLRDLETRPGRNFGGRRPIYIEPDVFVIKVGDQYVIQLNEEGLPRLRVSRAYRKMLAELRTSSQASDAKEFLAQRMKSALWLIKSLDQRQRTIYKVAASIVRQQHAFFEHGLEHLRPMVLRDVASDIGMHESTVSRVVANKYMHTPRGLLPMKFFFHSSIDRDFGDDISSLVVKQKLKQLIEAEDPRHPLSDSELARALQREGIHIARRTVAKYRDELGLPSSAERKRTSGGLA